MKLFFQQPGTRPLMVPSPIVMQIYHRRLVTKQIIILIVLGNLVSSTVSTLNIPEHLLSFRLKIPTSKEHLLSSQVERFTSPGHLVSPPVLMLTTPRYLVLALICVGQYSRAPALIPRCDANFARAHCLANPVWLLRCGLTSHSAIFEPFSVPRFVQFANLDLLPGHLNCRVRTYHGTGPIHSKASVTSFPSQGPHAVRVCRKLNPNLRIHCTAHNLQAIAMGVPAVILTFFTSSKVLTDHCQLFCLLLKPFE